jgi:hypothetical protein
MLQVQGSTSRRPSCCTSVSEDHEGSNPAVQKEIAFRSVEFEQPSLPQSGDGRRGNTPQSHQHAIMKETLLMRREVAWSTTRWSS